MYSHASVPRAQYCSGIPEPSGRRVIVPSPWEYFREENGQITRAHMHTRECVACAEREKQVATHIRRARVAKCGRHFGNGAGAA